MLREPFTTTTIPLSSDKCALAEFVYELGENLLLDSAAARKLLDL